MKSPSPYLFIESILLHKLIYCLAIEENLDWPTYADLQNAYSLIAEMTSLNRILDVNV